MTALTGDFVFNLQQFIHVLMGYRNCSEVVIIVVEALWVEQDLYRTFATKYLVWGEFKWFYEPVNQKMDLYYNFNCNVLQRLEKQTTYALLPTLKCTLLKEKWNNVSG